MMMSAKQMIEVITAIVQTPITVINIATIIGIEKATYDKKVLLQQSQKAPLRRIQNLSIEKNEIISVKF